jgi:hypothetical protein
MASTKSELEAKLGTGALTEHAHQFGATVYSFAVPGKDAVSTWRKLRQSAPSLGCWPVIFGEPKSEQRVCEIFGTKYAINPEETIRSASDGDVQKYFAARADEFPGDGVRGEWPKDAKEMTMMEFTIPREILGQRNFHASVAIGLVPVSHSWQAPAVLSFGGWNDCPDPASQVAVLRYWNEVYGAELVGLSGDVMELQPARKPSTRDEALKLAQEQYWFCTDIVEQGVGTIENLAAGLMASSVWYFWWD